MNDKWDDETKYDNKVAHESIVPENDSAGEQSATELQHQQLEAGSSDKVPQLSRPTATEDGLRQQHLSTLVAIWQRLDEGFFSSFNIFVLAQGILVAGFLQVDSSAKLVKIVCACIGAFLSVAWMLVMHRKQAHTHMVEDCCREVERRTRALVDEERYFVQAGGEFHPPDPNSQPKARRGKLARFPSWKIVAFVIPLGMTVSWVLFLLMTFLGWS